MVEQAQTASNLQLISSSTFRSFDTLAGIGCSRLLANPNTYIRISIYIVGPNAFDLGSSQLLRTVQCIFWAREI